MKKTVLLILLMPATLVFAGGQKEEWKNVNGLENWHYDFDISQLKPDTYNLVLRAKDGAGNVSIAGPINFKVDPQSDIPSIRIGSPLPGARSTGNINVVGTAVDDDAIDFVEVQLGDDGEVLKANGQRYWSYFFNLENLPDGVYKVRARATDTNGKQSPWSEVSFHLDQKKPVARVESHPIGALVKGRFRIQGTILEPNGIQRFLVSEGGQENYREVSFSKVNDQGVFRFDYEIDTTKQQDGPNILWFRSVNPLGNVGNDSFLYFVDNTPPTIEFFEPKTEENLPGFVSVIGAVNDQVGIQKVSWEAEGNVRGELQLVPGNPFFHVPLTYVNQNGRKRIRFQIEDKIGNVKSFEHFFTLSLEADRPTLTASVISDPGYPIRIVGFARDPDGVAKIVYTVEGGPSGEVESKGAFLIELANLPPGKRKITLTAKDAKGIDSTPVRLDIETAPKPPVWDVSSFAFTFGSGNTARNEPYRPGMFLPAEGQNARPPSFTGRILTDDARLGEVIYTVSGGRGGRVSARKEGEAYRFEIPLSDIVRPNTGNVNLKGPLTINLSVRGSVGSEVPYSIFILREDPSVGEGTEPLFSQGLGNNERMIVTENHPFQIVVPGEIASVSLQPATQVVTTEVLPLGTVTLVKVKTGTTPGIARNVRLVANTGANLGTFTFVTDLEGPAVTLKNPEISSWNANTLGLSLELADAGGIQTLEYALNQEDFKVVPGFNPANRLVNSQIPLANIPDGDLLLRIRATDSSGNARLVYQPVFKSTAGAQLTILAPPQGVAVDGKTLVVGRLQSQAPILKLEYSEDNRNWEPMEFSAIFQRFIDFSKNPMPDVYRFRITTASGVTNVQEVKFTVDRQKDIPVVNMQIPVEKEILRSDFAISGLVIDDDGVGAVYVRLNGQGSFTKLEGGNSFSLPISLNDIKDTDHFVEVYAEDINGTKSEIIKRNFTVSRSGPTSQLTAPDVRVTQRGKVNLQGKSEDPNGVESVFISIDNGNTFFKMKGQETWSYDLDTSLIQDGIYTLLIRAFDKTGASADYNVLFSVDNTKPHVNLTSPVDGDQVIGKLVFEGRAEDNMILRSLRYSIRPIGAVRPPLTGDFPLSGAGLTSRVDISGLQPGWYNMSLEAIDDAGNVTLVTRNVQVMEQAVADKVEVSFPALGQQISGPIAINGRVFARQIPEKAVVLINGRIISTIDVSTEGYFNGTVLASDIIPLLTADSRKPGKTQTLNLQVEIQIDNKKVTSLPRQIEYMLQGPWIRVTSHKHGDFISNRPYLTGFVGYYTEPLETPSAEAAATEGGVPAAPRYGEFQLTLEEIRRQPINIEVSLNNGMTFEKVEQWEARVTEGSGLVKGDREWRYRLQTHTFSQGPITVLIRTGFADGSVTTSRMILFTDTVAPRVEILVPDQAEGSFNEVIRLAGTARDESKLTAVQVMLNRGRYTPPSFIDGLYVDGYGLGATLWSAGLGFFFFQEAVRLQAQTGFIAKSEENSRFYGYAHGVKLMAKVFSLEWESIFGPDAEAFSTSALIGANFTYFTQDPSNIAAFGSGVLLTSFLGQVEFIQIKNKRFAFFNSLGIYGEYSGWIISSDLSPTVISKFSLGARFNLWNQIRDQR